MVELGTLSLEGPYQLRHHACERLPATLGHGDDYDRCIQNEVN